MSEHIVHFQKDEIIFNEGIHENWMFSIVKGSVNIYANYGEENQRQLVQLDAGKFFGEFALAELMPRSATAVAAEDGTELMKISSDNFYDCFTANSKMVINMLRNLSFRLRGLTSDFEEACQTVYELNEQRKKNAGRSEGLLSRIAKLVRVNRDPAIIFTAETQSKAMDEAEWHHSEMRTYAAKQVIFRQGEPSGCMYDISWGRVGIYVNYKKPTEKLLVMLQEGGVFGEMGVLDQAPRSATAVALEDNTKLQIISPSALEKYLRLNPGNALAIMQNLCKRIRRLSESYLELCKTVDEMENSDPAKSESLHEKLEKYIEFYQQAQFF